MQLQIVLFLIYKIWQMFVETQLTNHLYINAFIKRYTACVFWNKCLNSVVNT